MKMGLKALISYTLGSLAYRLYMGYDGMVSSGPLRPVIDTAGWARRMKGRTISSGELVQSLTLGEVVRKGVSIRFERGNELALAFLVNNKLIDCLDRADGHCVE